MELTEILDKRRSVRHYKKTPVPRGMLINLIEVAQKAPVSCNLQVVHYVIVDDKDKLASLAKNVSYKFSYAPACIVVLYDPRVTAERGSVITGTGMAIQNMILRAVDLGLATCPMAGFHHDERIKELLSIPPELSILLLLSVGYEDTSVYTHHIFKIPLLQTYSLNSFSGSVWNISQRLSEHSVSGIIDYRSRIAPVYLDRWRLNTFSSVYYDRAYGFFEKHVKGGSGTVLDVMSYDGTFLKMLCEKSNIDPKHIIASDYIENNLDFFQKKLGCRIEKVDVSNKISGLKDGLVECATCVFQIEFTPNADVLLEEVINKLKPSGKLFVAFVKHTWYRRIISTLWLSYKKVFFRKFVNIYENNPFYKVGAHQNINFSSLKRKLIKLGCNLEHVEKSGAGRGVRIVFASFVKNQ